MAHIIWNTNSGSIGTFPSNIEMEYYLNAEPNVDSTAITITYKILSGELPAGITLSTDGLISGTPDSIIKEITTTFVVRAKDDRDNISDRTFSITITGISVPKITTEMGSLFVDNLLMNGAYVDGLLDSTWVEYPIDYFNPLNSNVVNFELVGGTLPPGLELLTSGIIRGYADPPIIRIVATEVTTLVTRTYQSNNRIECASTTNFYPGRPIVFTTNVAMLGGLQENKTYYVKNVIDNTTFTVSLTENGPTLPLLDSTGFMDARLPSLSGDRPTIRTYNFTVRLISALGSDSKTFNITIYNQQTPIAQGGPQKPLNTRIPSILNVKPLTILLEDSDIYYGYYKFPNNSNYVYASNEVVDLGFAFSDDQFAFKIIGHDFDRGDITYHATDLSSQLTLDEETGWITGTPTLTNDGIVDFYFSAYVAKLLNPNIVSETVTFRYRLVKGVKGVITWLSDNNIGTVLNGTLCTLGVYAESDIDLKYRLIPNTGDLPPNLTLLDNGQLTGYVAFQPTTELLKSPDKSTFTFTIEAYSDIYPVVTSRKEFTVEVLQEYDNPTDTLYIQCNPDLGDRFILNTLLSDTTIIPDEYLYRPYDLDFGKATSIKYAHAYGIKTSAVHAYINSININHYNKSITLGSIKTAVAKNEQGEIIYEVVYSQIIDDLVNPNGKSVSKRVFYGKKINSTYLSSLYPNSLKNMREQVISNIGQVYDYRLLPLWMTSQQANGSTLGYTQAWVICYTLPGKSEIIKNNIETMWKRPEGIPYKLNEINFEVDRFTVNKSTTYNYNLTIDPPAWTSLPSGKPTPDPINKHDFNVFFPRKTILPNS